LAVVDLLITVVGLRKLTVAQTVGCNYVNDTKNYKWRIGSNVVGSGRGLM